ncbi:MAG: hypothetical protein ACE14W_00240 [Candidatus Velamenicoccus archaeovorus]
MTVPTIEALLRRLDDDGIAYCHWKSNWALAETLQGGTDLDLLIERGGAHRFRGILAELGFEPSVEVGVRTIPSTEHHMALDPTSGRIVHVHAYYRVITGESLSKNYHLPVEEMLLSNTQREGDVVVPTRGAELIVFVLRMLVKHTTAIELALLLRQWSNVRREVAWLMTDPALEEAEKLLPTWLPTLDPQLFRDGYEALKRPAPLRRRVGLGYRVRSALRAYRRRSVVKARVAGAAKLAGVVSHRVTGASKRLSPAGGGSVIAFVGSEASGKSTIIDHVHGWLGETYTVRRVHAGKPPSTPLTLLPHTVLPAFRALFPDQRLTHVEARRRGTEPERQGPAPLLFALRSVMLAYERRALLVRAFAHASDGEIVLCDRYPSSRSGALDSPQLGHLPAPDGLRRMLAALEARLYDDIPPPDLVVYLSAPLEVTLARNAARGKVEPEPYVRYRHAMSSSLEFEGVAVRRISTDRPLEEVLNDVREVIWGTL